MLRLAQPLIKGFIGGPIAETALLVLEALQLPALHKVIEVGDALSYCQSNLVLNPPIQSGDNHQMGMDISTRLRSNLVKKHQIGARSGEKSPDGSPDCDRNLVTLVHSEP